MIQHLTVSFDDEPLILVDEQDHAIGYATKISAHEGAGLLHRAFSIFLFAADGRVLLQRRGATKPLWPLHWSNSCCSHPRRGENDAQATQRRLREELGLVTELRFLYRFRYRARYRTVGAEHELCSVYVGTLPEACAIDANPHEIADWQWCDRATVERLIATQPEQVTPWFVMEWACLRDMAACM